MQDIVPWTLGEDFESKIKENIKQIVSIAKYLTRLIAGNKRLRMFLTLSSVKPCIVNTDRSKRMFVESVIL